MKVLNERACLIARIQSMHGWVIFSLIPAWLVSEPQAKKNASRSSVRDNWELWKGNVGFDVGRFDKNLRYALWPVWYVLCDEGFNAEE